MDAGKKKPGAGGEKAPHRNAIALTGAADQSFTTNVLTQALRISLFALLHIITMFFRFGGAFSSFAYGAFHRQFFNFRTDTFHIDQVHTGHIPQL